MLDDDEMEEILFEREKKILGDFFCNIYDLDELCDYVENTLNATEAYMTVSSKEGNKEEH